MIKEWNVKEQLSASMGDDEQLVIFIHLFDKYGSDVIDKVAKSNKMEILLTLHCYDESMYNEKIIITKQFVEDYILSLKKENVELMVSAYYEVQEV